jgi:hypothetical protein
MLHYCCCCWSFKTPPVHQAWRQGFSSSRPRSPSRDVHTQYVAFVNRVIAVAAAAVPGPSLQLLLVTQDAACSSAVQRQLAIPARLCSPDMRTRFFSHRSPSLFNHRALSILILLLFLFRLLLLLLLLLSLNLYALSLLILPLLVGLLLLNPGELWMLILSLQFPNTQLKTPHISASVPLQPNFQPDPVHQTSDPVYRDGSCSCWAVPRSPPHKAQSIFRVLLLLLVSSARLSPKHC